MNITKFISGLLLSILLITSCSEDPISDMPSQDSQELESRQWVRDDFVPFDPCAGAVTVYVPPCFTGTGYEEAIPASLDAIMAVSSVEFVIVNDPNADLEFICTQGGRCGSGFGRWPTDGQIGEYIRLAINPTVCNSTINGPDCDASDLDLCFYMRTAIHEIMHTLGVVHNDDPGFNSLHVPGTPLGYESGSLMNTGAAVFLSGNWCNAVCTLTENDIAALSYLYPPCDVCVAECPTVDATKIESTDGCCQWTIDLQAYSQCEYYYDIRGPSVTSIDNEIPNGYSTFDTENICCDGGAIIINIYGLDANGARFECETIELICCQLSTNPCGSCPETVLTEYEQPDGCKYWDVRLTNFSRCQYYYDIYSPAPARPSIGNVIAAPDPFGPIGNAVSFTTNTVCCKEGPVIIFVYAIAPNGEKIYCDPIVLSACEDECKDMEGCLIVGFEAGSHCKLRPFFNGCGLPSVVNGSYSWLSPSGVVSTGPTVDVREDGVYCLTIVFPNDCVLTDCIVIEGCHGNGDVSVGN